MARVEQDQGSYGDPWRPFALASTLELVYVFDLVRGASVPPRCSSPRPVASAAAATARTTAPPVGPLPAGPRCATRFVARPGRREPDQGPGSQF
jgi:hypothetical protein